MNILASYGRDGQRWSIIVDYTTENAEANDLNAEAWFSFESSGNEIHIDWDKIYTKKTRTAVYTRVIRKGINK